MGVPAPGGGRSSAQAPGPAARDEETPEAGLVLVSASAELGERLAALVPAGLPPLRRVAPTLQSVKDLGPSRKALVILHADSAAWEARKRLRTLAEALPAALPRVLIGTGVDPGHLAEMGAEVKASWTYPLQASPGSHFRAAAAGIFRSTSPSLIALRAVPGAHWRSPGGLRRSPPGCS